MNKQYVLCEGHFGYVNHLFSKQRKQMNVLSTSICE